ncbi:Alpha-tocopherol transfer protein-like [Frankliniella fusca]|uniref:Alpha-tocopherol transfer protein-like n=1 Tax=Frankliniella fusca TaxID=407009 RepID=A0AAE1HTQ2_9NEOP|nr:Alpha-tocopherol transfer protein-like [Frankliniella fusca]
MALRQLTPELEERAKQELGEDPARRQADIDAIKTWLSKQAHLNANTEDQWILTFLRGCKFSLERTKEKIDSYYTFRTLLPEFFTNRDPLQPELQEILKLGICFPLPHPDPNGRKIFLLRVGQYDPSRIKLSDVMKLNYINMDITLKEDDRTIICGDVLIMDMRGVTLSHAAQVQPALLKKASTVYQDAYPVRPQGMHYVYAPATFESMISLIKSFMKDKLRKRMSVHGNNIENLYKDIPQRCLPNEYGGEAGPIAELAAAWKAKVESNRDWLLADEQRRSDERKRPGRPKTTDNIFGVEGSFRKLDFD